MLFDETLKEFREKLDKKYIGFSANGSSVKPVHIANGLFRTVLGYAYDTDTIGKFSYTKSNKGVTKPAAQLKKVYKEYTDNNRIEVTNINKDSFELLRSTAQSIIEADKGVYDLAGSGMVSYTLPSKYFLTTSKTLTVAGDFIGSLIRESKSKIIQMIEKDLNNENDPITLLFYPAIKFEEPQQKEIELMDLQEVEGYKRRNYDVLIKNIGEAFDCLESNLQIHPNKFVHLRQINFLAIYEIILYVANLEYIYKVTDVKRPFLLDCSNDSKSEIANASSFCISQINQSMSRCYSKFIADELKFELTINEILQNPETPKYDNKKQKKENKQAFDEIWTTTKESVSKTENEDEQYLLFGSAIYNMLEIEGSSTVIKYLKALGIRAGIFYPQSNSVPNKRFVLATETLEVVLKSCIKPNVSMTLDELLDILCERFNIIVGGRDKDEAILQEAGIIHADSDALKENQRNFIKQLETMNFAELLADGILQIKTGGEQ